MRTCVVGDYRLALFVLYRSSTTYLYMSCRQRGGWLRAARSIPKVALAYRLHARAARVYLERRGACARYHPPLRTNTKTILLSLVFVRLPRENPPSFPRDIPRAMQDIDNIMKTYTRCCPSECFVENFTNAPRRNSLEIQKDCGIYNLTVAYFIKRLW